MGRVVTSLGRSVGQHVRSTWATRVPMTTSAACGRPVQQAGLTETMLEVPTLSTATKPSSARRYTWWEQVDCLIPSAVARSPMRMAPAGEVATAFSNRTRVGSARVENHFAYWSKGSASTSGRTRRSLAWTGVLVFVPVATRSGYIAVLCCFP